MGRNIRPYDMLKAARRDKRQLHLDAHFLSANLPTAIEAHKAALPHARKHTKTVLAGTYEGPAQETFDSVQKLVAEAQELTGLAKWQVLGLRDGLDLVENPMDYPVCEPVYKDAQQEDLLK